MKILFLQDDFPPHARGGAGIVAAMYARELVKRGHALTVVTAVQDRSLAGSFHEEGMRVERIYSEYAPRWRAWLSLYNPATIPAARRILAEARPDIVHAHNVHYHLSYWVLRLAKQGGAKVFLTAHDVMLFHYGKLVEFIDPAHPECRKDWDYRISPWQQLRRYRFWYNPFRNAVIRKLLRNVDKVFAVSAALKDAIEQNGIRRVEVLYNGIDAAEWQVAPATVDDFVRKYGLAGKSVILFGGRISALKGGEVMVSALRDIVRAEPSAVLLLLGAHDAYVEELMRRAAEQGNGGHVVPTGWLSGDERYAAYHAAAVVVMPSLYLEPLGMTALEAMVCGKPVVGSCFGGIPELVADDRTGFTVNPYDTKMLARRVTELLADTRKRAAFGEAARERSRDFTLQACTDRLLSAYCAEGSAETDRA